MEGKTMNKIKIIMNDLDIRELCLMVTGEYTKDLPIIERENSDIIVTIDRELYTDKIYGREIQGKYYFARHKIITKGKPDIDYYDEFFCTGKVLNFQ
jgi:TFIIF-interacting CTD phosphatase-like protein